MSSEAPTSQQCSKPAPSLLHHVSSYLAETLDSHPSYTIFLFSTPFSSKAPIIQSPAPSTSVLGRHFLLFLVEHLSPTQQVFVTAIEAYEYLSRASNSVTLYISKVDTTGWSTVQSKSPTKPFVSAFLKWYKRENRNSTKIHLFARPQPQYLFPGSAEIGGPKRVLNDVELIRWWKRVLSDAFVDENTNEEEQKNAGNKILQEHVMGYYFIPGVQNEYGARILIKDLPPSVSEQRFWSYGYPFPDDAFAADVIPRFEDDAKARVLLHFEGGDGHDKLSDAVQKEESETTSLTVKEFWELMSISVECSAGRSAAFFWVLLPSAVYSKESNNSDPQYDEKDIGGLIIAPEQFCEAITLLESLEFGKLTKAIESTKVFTQLLENWKQPSMKKEVSITIPASNNSNSRIIDGAKESQSSATTNVKINNLQNSIKRKNTSDFDDTASANVKVNKPVNVLSPSIIKRVKKK